MGFILFLSAQCFALKILPNVPQRIEIFCVFLPDVQDSSNVVLYEFIQIVSFLLVDTYV